MKNNLQKLISELGVVEYPGSTMVVGKAYHDLPFEDLKIPSHRKKTRLRVEKIIKVYDIKGKSGIDLGCNVGGITFGLQLAGAHMLGVDCGGDSINLANEVEKEYKTGAKFLCRDINYKFIFSEMDWYDFIIFFDSWMWIAKRYGLEEAKVILNCVSMCAPNLFFSTSQNDGMARLRGIKTSLDVLTLLKEVTRYKKYDDLGTVEDGWHKRTIFHCHG